MARTRSSVALGLVTALLAALGIAGAPSAQAAVFTVTTSTDGDDGTCTAGHCTLREAINAANSAGAGNTISFAPATDGTPVAVTSGLPEITVGVTVTGNGAGTTVVDGAGLHSLVSVTGAVAVVVRDLTLTNASRAGSGASARALSGATLTLDRLVVSNSTAVGANGGGLFAGAGSTVAITGSTIHGNSAFAGGGVATAGTLTVRSSTLTANTAATLGGAMFVEPSGTASLVDSTIVGNLAMEAAAGYVSSGSVLRTVFSTVSGNASSGGSLAATVSGPGSFSATGSILSSPDVLCLLPLSVGGDGFNVYREPGGADTCHLGAASGNVNADPLLTALTDNGGPTQTMRPGPGSPAALGSMPRAAALAVLGDAADQRGQIRHGDFWIGSVQDVATVSPAPTAVTFPNTLVGSSVDRVVTVANSGPGDLYPTSLQVSGADAARFAVVAAGTSCADGVRVDAGSNCQVTIRFDPAAVTTYTATLQLAGNAVGDPVTVPLTGRGAGPSATLTPTSLTFPTTAAGTQADLPFAILNPGTADLRVTSVSVIGADADKFSVITPSCDLSQPIAPGEGCSFRARMSATSPGTYRASVVVVDDGVGGTGTLPMTGQVVWPAVVVSAVTPATGHTTGGTAVTITGQNFRAAPQVTFGGLPASEVTLVSAQEIRAVSPAHAVGAVDVAVTDAEAGTGTLPQGFAYTADTAPVPASLAPGDATMLVNGQPVPVGVTIGPAGTGLVASGGGVTLQLAGLAWLGGPQLVIPDGILVMNPGGALSVTGGGLLPGTTASLWFLGGTGTRQRAATEPDGRAEVGAGGTFTLQAPVAADAGPVTVQVTGVSDAGFPVVVTLGAQVIPAGRTTQRPVRSLRLPDSLRDMGFTRLVDLPVRTNAGHVARVRVTCFPAVRATPTGDAVSCRVVRTRRSIGVRLTGALATVVLVRIHAPAVRGYTAYTRTVRYRTHAVN